MQWNRLAGEASSLVWTILLIMTLVSVLLVLALTLVLQHILVPQPTDVLGHDRSATRIPPTFCFFVGHDYSGLC